MVRLTTGAKRIGKLHVPWLCFPRSPSEEPLSIYALCSRTIAKIPIFFPEIKRNLSRTQETMASRLHSILGWRERHCKEKTKKLAVTSNTRISMDEDDAFEDAVATGTPLSAVAEAFEELSALVESGGVDFDLSLKPFCDACSLVSVLFGCLGIAFKFAQFEYVSKVRDLDEASEIYGTLNNILDSDVENDTVKSPGSLSRNLRRVRQGLDLIRSLFQNFLLTSECSLREAASTAYAKVCAPYHTWAVRTAVSAGMYSLPTREQLLEKLNETDESAEREMRRYIKASRPIIEYIDMLYISRNISLDW